DFEVRDSGQSSRFEIDRAVDFSLDDRMEAHAASRPREFRQARRGGGDFGFWVRRIRAANFRTDESQGNLPKAVFRFAPRTDEPVFEARPTQGHLARLLAERVSVRAGVLGASQLFEDDFPPIRSRPFAGD